jgi:hypothetical protein
MAIAYRRFIESRFKIVSKKMEQVDFKFNKVQEQFIEKDFANKSIILKARQQGFSSVITALFTSDFILEPHSYSVVVADIEENAEGLLSKVKGYIESYEQITGQKVPLKYNSRYELYNPFMDTTYKIGTAKNQEFGRSKTIKNLHLSEVAFYPNIEKIIAGAGQAVVEDGRFIMETTANGFNDFKKFYEDSKSGLNNHKALFYKASNFYSKEFLDMKRKELGEKFNQEYPENDTEAFLTSGDCYFNKDSLKIYFENIKQPMKESLIYAA